MNERTAGWIGIGFALALPTLATLTYFVWAAGSPQIVQQAAYASAKLLQFSFPIVWTRFVLGRPIAILRGRGGIGAGVAFGALVLGLALVAYHQWFRAEPFLAAAAGTAREKVLGFGADTPSKYAALGAFYSLAHSFLEEYYWRWFVFGQLRRRLALGPAILVSSLGFAAHHVVLLSTFLGPAPWVTFLFSLAVAVGGAFWAWLYARHGSLWGPWLSHSLVDVAIFLVGYDLVRGAL